MNKNNRIWDNMDNEIMDDKFFFGFEKKNAFFKIEEK